MHCGDQRHLGLCLGYVPALAYGSCRVSDQGTTLRASDLHNARATILNPFSTLTSLANGLLNRAGASTTRFTSTSTSTCNMCEYEYESEYLIITWVRVRVRVLVDEYEYKHEYRSMINILYTCSMYRQQIFIVRSLTRESSNSYKPGTKLQLPIVLVNYPCRYASA